MVKEIILEPERSFGEFSLLPGYTPEGVNVKTIDLETKLHNNLIVDVPFFSAAMGSVTGEQMALSLGAVGGMAFLPVRMPLDEQLRIVKKVKSEDMKFIEDPKVTKFDTPLERVLKKMTETGHSHIPIIDRDNFFQGMFHIDNYYSTGALPSDLVSSITTPKDKVPVYNNPNMSIKEAQKILSEIDENYIVIITKDGRLRNLAFEKDLRGLKIASSISTHGDWKEVVEANIDAGVDLISIDTSDSHFHYVKDIVKDIKEFKKMTDIPLSVGNVVTAEAARFLMDAGADIVKIGMSTGSICTTQREKATGRASFAALNDVINAREQYEKDTGIYVPLIVDGGISKYQDMIIALTMADGIMMGNYFNSFWESAGTKFDKDGKETNLISETVKVETYGEGSWKARNLGRYGHAGMKDFFPEGEPGTVDYAGLLKPNVKNAIKRVKKAMENVGAKDLYEFREKAVIALMSDYTRGVVGSTHSIEVKK